MRVGYSTLGAPSGTWLNAHHRSAAAEPCASAANEAGQNDLALSAIVAEIHELIEERRTPDPAAFHQLTHVGQAAVRHAPVPERHVDGPQWVRPPDGFETLGDYRVRVKGRVPAPDESGIIRRKRRDYIQVDGRYYPVRHDKDAQTWRVYKERNPAAGAIPVRYDASHGKWKIHDAVGSRGCSPIEPPSLGKLPRELVSMIANHLPNQDIGCLSQVNRHLHGALAKERQASRLLAQAQRAKRLTEFQALLGAPRAGMEVIRDLRVSLQERLLVVLTGRIPALPIRGREVARQLVRNTETLLRMAPDVRQHYTDSGWIDQLAIVPDPEGTSVTFGRVVSCGIVVDAQPQYWTGTVQFGQAGNRNVLLEPVDAGGTTRWYLAGQNGERLSQYLDRRYGGRLTPDSAPPT